MRYSFVGPINLIRHSHGKLPRIEKGGWRGDSLHIHRLIGRDMVAVPGLCQGFASISANSISIRQHTALAKVDVRIWARDVSAVLAGGTCGAVPAASEPECLTGARRARKVRHSWHAGMWRG